MEIKEIIGQNIARYRKEKDFTQEDLAKELGISFQAISKWERGNAFVNTFRADINDYRMNSKYDILKFEEVIFDCQSSGIPHKHAMNIIIARKR